MKDKNKIVNIINSFTFLISFISGIIVWLFLPSGQGFRGVQDKLFFGLARHNWIDIHIISSLIFIGLTIVHLILHWRWIKNLFKSFND